MAAHSTQCNLTLKGSANATSTIRNYVVCIGNSKSMFYETSHTQKRTHWRIFLPLSDYSSDRKMINSTQSTIIRSGYYSPDFFHVQFFPPQCHFILILLILSLMFLLLAYNISLVYTKTSGFCFENGSYYLLTLKYIFSFIGGFILI